MAANRITGVRAAVYYGGEPEIITRSREHNDANVLSLGARFVGVRDARDAVRLWLTTDFSREPRHIRRHAALDVL
jgi:ribose 5-phosphate isomerase B